MSLIRGTVRPLLEIISSFSSDYPSLNLDSSLENLLSVISTLPIVTWTPATFPGTLASIHAKCTIKSLHLAQTGWTGHVPLLFRQKRRVEKRNERVLFSLRARVRDTSQFSFFFFFKALIAALSLVNFSFLTSECCTADRRSV